MLGAKEKAKERINIIVTNAAGNVLYDGRLTGLTLTEEMVKSLSVLFFDDPEPCEIHRSAVLSRVFMEIQEAIGSGEDTELSESDALAAYFSFYPGVRRVRLYIGRSRGGRAWTTY